jgi:hypothetical protein
VAIAKTVLDCEPVRLDWLKIEDEDGAIWKYGRRENASLDTPAHVEGQYYGGSKIRAALVRGADGKPILRQDGPGLPLKIVVNYVTPGGAGLPGTAAWYGMVEYEQE